jgi:hypothetical protein
MTARSLGVSRKAGGESADSWRFDVLWAAREAIEAADPWDNHAAFIVALAGRTLELCGVIDTTCGRALHILTAYELELGEDIRKIVSLPSAIHDRIVELSACRLTPYLIERRMVLGSTLSSVAIV